MTIALAKYSEDEPRDEAGRWTDGGSDTTASHADYAEFESRIAAMNPSREYGAVYRDGQKIWEGKGAKGSIRYPPDLRYQGAQLTHFHPSSVVAFDASGKLVGKPSPGATLSNGDVESHLRWALGSMRCFDNAGHWMQVDGQGSRMVFQMAWRSEWGLAQKTYDRWISDVSHRPGTWNGDDDARKQFEVYRDAIVASATKAGLTVTYG